MSDCNSVLDQYGTLPVMLQALLELSSTVNDKWDRQNYQPNIALQQMQWHVQQNDTNTDILLFCLKKSNGQGKDINILKLEC